MFGIEVTLLTGRYVATSYNNRKQPEWPPHPARMFSALVAEHAEAGFCSEETTALEWLESLEPPEIYASPAENRTIVGYYVPVNDTHIISIDKSAQLAIEIKELTDQVRELTASNGASSKIEQLRKKLGERLTFANSLANKVGQTNHENAIKIAIKMFPDQRTKQLRHFPSCVPENPNVAFIWHEDCTDANVRILDNLLSRVTRLGHSSSLVSCRLTNSLRDTNYKPSKRGFNTLPLRGIRSGQLKELTQQFRIHQGFRPRVLPFEIVEYRNTDTDDSHDKSFVEPNSTGDWIVFEFSHGSRNFPSTRSHEIAKTMRASIFRYIDDPIPEEISGHMPDGSPTREPHVAFQPIPFVGHPHADGRLLGIVIMVPKSISDLARHTLFEAIGRWEKRTHNSGLQLYLHSKQAISLKRLIGQSDLKALRPSTWRNRSRKWASVIPIALPRHPGRLFGGTSAARKKAWQLAKLAVSQSCRHLDLDKPANITVSSAPFVSGCRSSRDYPPLKYDGNTANTTTRQLIHATVEFSSPVQGPLILGSGRFVGLGLMYPMFEHNEQESHNTEE